MKNEVNEPMKLGLDSLVKLNPSVAFFLKYWHIITIAVLLIFSGLLGWGAWKYHEYMNNKMADVKVELQTYKDQAALLQDSLDTMKQDVEIAKRSVEQFNNDVAEIRKENAELRVRINGLSKKITPATPSPEAQAVVDQILDDVNTKWESIGVKK